MPKLVLRFEDRVLKECALSSAVTIGRLPDNTVSIDNPAVSARHARIDRSGDLFIVEDLESRNGTFVNDHRVTRHVLRPGDVVQVGKHTLVYDQTVADDPAATVTAQPTMPDFGGTMLLDTEQQRKLLAAVANLQAQKAASAPKGVLRVISGRSDRSEYALGAQESTIGKSASALVRLRGWFKPQLAVAIARMGESYVATPVGGRTFVNGQRLVARRGLEHGDLLQLAGLTLEFRLEAAAEAVRKAS
jgi:predicted component of type VI protein secretion system